jgi:hypothetical protein
MTFAIPALFSIAIYGYMHDLPYGVSQALWESKLGNHRARINVSQKADAVLVDISWRRREPSPEKKAVLIFDSTTGKQITNVKVLELNREFGKIVFQAENSGEYYIYYMPYTANTLPWGYTTEYTPPQNTADQAWLDSMPAIEQLPCAEVLEIQARTEFDRFDPMEVIATADEVKELVENNQSRSYLLFPEDRKYSIRMTDDLPLRWIRKGTSTEFYGETQLGEFYVFQMGVFPIKDRIEDIDISFSDLRSEKDMITADQIRCFNKGGTDWLGRKIIKAVSVDAGKVGALWFGVQIPLDVKAGVYQGTVKLKPKNAEESTVNLSLAISNEIAVDNGDNELWKQSRLKWLDSIIGLDDEITDPYTPLKVQNKSIECLGRSVKFADTGLPESIKSGSREILASQAKMIVETGDEQIALTESHINLVKETPGTVVWNSSSKGDGIEMECETRMEFDGFINFHISLNPQKAMSVKDIYLDIPIKRNVANYMMGMGCKGGYRPKEWEWVWDEKLANNSIWIGDVNAGIHCKFKGTEDIWELYSLKASGIPKDWNNNGKGGCMVFEKDDQVILRAYSGNRSLKQGEKMDFCFSLLVTPLKPLSPAHWNQRYYHAYVPISTVKESGANIVNVHHGNDINPNINYPFIFADKMASYVKEAHDNGIKVKIYYTIRELSNYTAEIWALRSLGNEIFTDGGGGGHSWLWEHLVSHYASAWHHTFSDTEVDAAIATTGLSRWHNYYLEGLRWLIKNVGIDGLYLDGIGYDREIMKRVRKVMDRERPGCLIDFHSGNNFHPQYGLSNCATQYMEHFPYIDSLWFGEGFDYDESPDFWLIEISGIPFGLYSEMLQNNGNPWRGMIYGMTNRLGWGGDPRPIWKAWDDFGIQDAQMIGYWESDCPVKTDNKDVLATVYRKEGKSLISIASWAKEAVTCKLSVDWKALGLDSNKAIFSAPEIKDFQPSTTFKPLDSIPIEPDRGWLLIVSE